MRRACYIARLMRRLVVVLALAAACDRAAAPQQRAPEPGSAVAGPAAATARPDKPGKPGKPELVPEPNRALTEGERSLLRPLFRDGIDYDRVRVIHASFPFQQRDVYMTPRGHIYAPGELFRDDFSRERRGLDRAVFVHEMTHVWQYANGMDLVGEGVMEFTKNRGQYEKAYPYVLAANRDLSDYGMEQQASIVEDYFLITSGAGEPVRLENRGLAPGERDALYAAVLARFLGNARYARELSPRELAERHAAASERTPPGPAACKESEAEHQTSHLCSWRYDAPAGAAKP